jgi:hypothetical protein
MMAMIKDIIKNSESIKVNGNVIDFGYKNGWYFNPELLEAFNKLKQYTVVGSQTGINLGRCINEYSCTIDDGTERYVLVYKVDSGD